MDAMGVGKKKELLSCSSKTPSTSQTETHCHLGRKMITRTVANGKSPFLTRYPDYASDYGIVFGLGILSNLSNLENINLRYNGLHNSILPSLNKLSNLKILNLAGNELNGSIFIKEFDGLSNLKELDLSKNAIANIRALNSNLFYFVM
ncbi:hypothetical protein RHSIM_Rhsim01G0111600 [Rhododendron simsii]|uniref:Uncharacterized protein n=1 Tax=Rhododendron simsii TaxID=118357 RepID=A0A834HGM5_RHOSS|nr:hypothetical protein RHSIM_Rhsim01G0111600 [Rhododendron simsii]